MRMLTKQILENALHDAMRQKDDISKNTLRILISSIKMVEIEKGISLDDTSLINVLNKEIKMRRESIVEFSKGNREDLVINAEKEIEILERFLPLQMSDIELRNAVKTTIIEVAALSVSDLGKVMKTLVPKLAGKASADRISSIARELLD
jgi:uncharacterized protein YqeY